MIEYKSGEELSFMKKSPHSPECVSSMVITESLLVLPVLKSAEKMDMMLIIRN